MKKKESIDEVYNNEVNENQEIENFKNQIDELQKQIEYLKNLVQTQQGAIINQQQQQYQQANKEYIVISMIDGVLGLKTRPEQTGPALKLHFKETYTIRNESELQDFYLANRSAFINKYLLFESPFAADVLHIQDVKNALDLATYDNLGNLSLEALERVYKSCKSWQKELILDKFITESAKGNSNYYNTEKLALLEKMRNEEIPTIVWNNKKNQEEQSYFYNINDKITKTRESLSSK